VTDGGRCVDAFTGTSRKEPLVVHRARPVADGISARRIITRGPPGILPMTSPNVPTSACGEWASQLCWRNTHGYRKGDLSKASGYKIGSCSLHD
jgi:hypothetical protein